MVSIVSVKDLVRTFKVFTSGYYDPGLYYEALGARFLYEVFYRSIKKKVLVYAINGISFKVEKGEFVCILGPNGSGKSTLIKILATLLEPSGGVVEVMGYDVVKERKEVVKRINYIPSLLAAGAWAHLNLTVRQNFKIMSRLLLLSEEELLEIAEKMGLKEVLDRPFGSLSTGQQARVSLTLGIIKKSPLYLLDEPTLGLSPEAVRFARDYLIELNERLGVTILYATHHALEAQEMANRIIILNHGRILADGEPRELIREANVKSSILLDLYKVFFDLNQLLKGFEAEYFKVEPISPGLGEYKVALGVKDSDAVLPKLINELISKGAKLKSVKVKEANLEDAYMKYLYKGEEYA